MRSLTTRFVTVSFIGISIAFILSAILLHRIISQIIASEFDSLLMIKANTAAGMIVVNKQNNYEFLYNSEEFGEHDRFHQLQYFQIYDTSTKTIFGQSRSSANHHFEYDCSRHPGDTRYKNIILPDGAQGRQLAYTYVAPRLEPATKTRRFCIVVAKNISEIDRLLKKFDEEISLWGLFSLAVLLPLSWFIVKSSLRPIRYLTSQIEQINARSLSVRMDPSGTPSELTIVVNTLNAMLKRMEYSFERERTFVTNAAHDLRTPLSGLRAILDVTESRQRTSEEYKTALSKCQSIVTSLEVLLASLLTLAKLEDVGTAEYQLKTDLITLIKEAWISYEGKLANKKASITWDFPPTPILMGNAYRIRLIANNLLDNATSYVNEGGIIRCSLKELETAVILEVSNSGATLSSEECSHVFERFWRGDSSRENSEGHHGLGLSIVQQAATSINGTVTCRSENGVFTITVSIPKTHSKL